MRQALGALESAGAVRRVPGRGGGTFVRAPKVERDLSRVVGVPALLRAQGITSGSRIINTAIAEADEETTSALALDPGTYVIDVVRIRLADGVPISLEHARFPAERFPQLLELPLGGSLYELLEEHYATCPARRRSTSRWSPRARTRPRCSAPSPGAPLLSITRTTKDQDGVAFEYSHDLFRADRTVISVRTPATPRRPGARAGWWPSALGSR